MKDESDSIQRAQSLIIQLPPHPFYPCREETFEYRVTSLAQAFVVPLKMMLPSRSSSFMLIRTKLHPPAQNQPSFFVYHCILRADVFKIIHLMRHEYRRERSRSRSFIASSQIVRAVGGSRPALARRRARSWGRRLISSIPTRSSHAAGSSAGICRLRLRG